MIQVIVSISSISPDVAKSSDEVVLEAARHNPKHFALLVDRYEEPFLRKARSIIKTREDAEEVVQDTFTRIYLYADRFHLKEGASFRSWAYAILVRVAYTRYNKMKRRQREQVSIDPTYYESFSEEENFLGALTVRDEVLAALSKIPEAAGKILRLQFLEGKTQEEIAHKEQITVSAVKTRVHRAKKLFKKRIEYDRNN